MKPLFILVCLLFSLAGVSQEIRGVVTDADTGEPLKDINIFFKSSKNGTSTDASGKFILFLVKTLTASDTVVFSSLGYSSLQFPAISLTEKENNIRLQKSTEALKTVSISSSKEGQPELKFRKMASLKRGVYGTAAVLVEDKIYVVGGNRSQFQDNARQLLARESTNPNSSFEGFLQKMTANFDYLGYDGSLQVYDVQEDSWDIDKKVFQSRAYHNVELIDNKLYILGGITTAGNMQKDQLDQTLEIYDLTQKTVTSEKNNPHLGVNFLTVHLGDLILCAGGSTQKDKEGKKVYNDALTIYDRTKNRYYDFGNLRTPKEAKGFIRGNLVYLLGNRGETFSTLETLDLDTEKWQTLERLRINLETAAVAYRDDMFYVYDEGWLYTYHVLDRELKNYRINLELFEAAMVVDAKALYLLGGYLNREFGFGPSSAVYKINLTEFDKTLAKEF